LWLTLCVTLQPHRAEGSFNIKRGCAIGNFLSAAYSLRQLADFVVLDHESPGTCVDGACSLRYVDRDTDKLLSDLANYVPSEAFVRATLTAATNGKQLSAQRLQELQGQSGHFDRSVQDRFSAHSSALNSAAASARSSEAQDAAPTGHTDPVAALESIVRQASSDVPVYLAHEPGENIRDMRGNSKTTKILFVPGLRYVTPLTRADMVSRRDSSAKPTFVMCVAHWSVAARDAAPRFLAAAKHVFGGFGVPLAAIDCAEETLACQDLQVGQTPTLFDLLGDGRVRPYTGGLDTSSLYVHATSLYRPAVEELAHLDDLQAHAEKLVARHKVLGGASWPFALGVFVGSGSLPSSFAELVAQHSGDMHFARVPSSADLPAGLYVLPGGSSDLQALESVELAGRPADVLWESIDTRRYPLWATIHADAVFSWMEGAHPVVIVRANAEDIPRIGQLLQPIVTQHRERLVFAVVDPGARKVRPSLALHVPQLSITHRLADATNTTAVAAFFARHAGQMSVADSMAKTASHAAGVVQSHMSAGRVDL
jgi:hypothetical protein